MEPFEEATQANNPTEVAALLRSGVPASSVTSTGLPWISLAAIHDRVDIVRTLIEAGADVDQRDRFGATALTSSSACGNFETVCVLLANGADADVIDQSRAISSRPIWQCVFSAESNLETLAALVGHGADTAGADEHGFTLDDWATPEQAAVLQQRKI